MTDTYSNDKTRVINQTEGGNSNSWGQIADANFEQLARAAAGYLSKAITGNTTLSESESQNCYIKLTGTLSAAATVTIPGYSGAYIVENATTGGYAVTVKTTPGTGVSITAGTKRWLFCDGTDTAVVSTALQADQNLADLASAATARTNLGLGALAVLNTVTNAQITDLTILEADLADNAVAWAKLKAALFNQTAVAPATGDKLVGADISDSGNSKVFTIADILALAASTVTLTNAGAGTSLLADAVGPDFTTRGLAAPSITQATSGSGTILDNVTLSGSWSVSTNDLVLNLTITRYRSSGGVGVGL